MRGEWVLAVQGVVIARPEGMTNTNLATGEIEVRITKLEVLSQAKTPPFEIEDDSDAGEALRLQYRYLDLRRSALRENFIKRHQATQVIRNFLTENHFVDVETPVLTRSTPEGARDYLVPSRLARGSSLRSPRVPNVQQILMVAVSSYYQI